MKDCAAPTAFCNAEWPVRHDYPHEKQAKSIQARLVLWKG
jgi:hypothetical protein